MNLCLNWKLLWKEAKCRPEASGSRSHDLYVTNATVFILFSFGFLAITALPVFLKLKMMKKLDQNFERMTSSKLTWICRRMQTLAPGNIFDFHLCKCRSQPEGLRKLKSFQGLWSVESSCDLYRKFIKLKTSTHSSALNLWIACKQKSNASVGLRISGN